MADRRCRLTMADGSTLTLWLPDFQVEAISDPNLPEGVALSKALGVVSIEVDVPGDDEPPKPIWKQRSNAASAANGRMMAHPGKGTTFSD